MEFALALYSRKILVAEFALALYGVFFKRPALSSAMLHRIKSFGLKARCRGARPTALVH